jgi:hypothetical protein
MDFRASSLPYRFDGPKGPWEIGRFEVLTGSPSSL